MNEARLDELIRRLHQTPLEQPQRKDCLPFAALWAHQASGQPLGASSEHVQQCPRCRRVLAIMRQELAAAQGPRGRTRPLRVAYRVSLPLAVAACIGLFFFVGRPGGEGPAGPSGSLSQEEIERMIAPFCESVYGRGVASRTRGSAPDESAEPDPAQAALERFLKDPRVVAAKARHLAVRLTLHREWQLDMITDNEQGHLTLTAAGLTCDRREELQELVQQENETRDTFVEAVRTHVPGVEAEDRELVRRALDQWLADQVLGIKQFL